MLTGQQTWPMSSYHCKVEVHHWCQDWDTQSHATLSPSSRCGVCPWIISSLCHTVLDETPVWWGKQMVALSADQTTAVGACPTVHWQPVASYESITHHWRCGHIIWFPQWYTGTCCWSHQSFWLDYLIQDLFLQRRGEWEVLQHCRHWA